MKYNYKQIWSCHLTEILINFSVSIISILSTKYYINTWLVNCAELLSVSFKLLHAAFSTVTCNHFYLFHVPNTCHSFCQLLEFQVLHHPVSLSSSPGVDQSIKFSIICTISVHHLDRCFTAVCPLWHKIFQSNQMHFATSYHMQISQLEPLIYLKWK